MVDCYERRAVNLALDVIQRAAAALDVSAAELIGDATESARASRRGGPTGKVQKVFEDVARLPGRQQEKIVEFVSAFVVQYEQSRQ